MTNTLTFTFAVVLDLDLDADPGHVADAMLDALCYAEIPGAHSVSGVDPIGPGFLTRTSWPGR